MYCCVCVRTVRTYCVVVLYSVQECSRAGLAEMSLEAEAESDGEHRALFTYRCEQSALVFLLSVRNVELLCRRARPLNLRLACLARDWLRHQLAILETAERSFSFANGTADDGNGADPRGNRKASSSTTRKAQRPQQRIAHCVARLETQAKRLEATRLPSPTRRASESAEAESREDEERRKLVELYIADRMQFLKPIVPGARY